MRTHVSKAATWFYAEVDHENFMPVANRANESAFIGIAWDQHCASVTAVTQSLRRIDSQTTFGLASLRTMALVTPLDENRADFLLEEVVALDGRT